jgi:hypothetical protein
MATNTKKAIFYKNYLGKWTQDKAAPATEKRLAWIKKHKAENGVATMQFI